MDVFPPTRYSATSRVLSHTSPLLRYFERNVIFTLYARRTVYAALTGVSM